MLPSPPLEQDNNIRKILTSQIIRKLRPAFDRKLHRTAAYSTPLTDGAAAVILMTESQAKEWG